MLKQFFLLLAAFIIVVFSGKAQNTGVTAYFSYGTFNRPAGEPYIETYLSVIASTVKFSANERGKFQSKVEVQWVLKSTDSTDGKIIYFDKYSLLSPELNSEADAKPNFIDQKRIPAANGNYMLELTISDRNTTSSKYTITEKVGINYSDDKPLFSDVELLESYSKATTSDKMSKSGYNLVPSISNFFPKEINSLKFYVELYNAKKIIGDDDFVVRYEIVNEGNKQIFGDLVGYKKMKADNVNVVLGELPLEQLPSGNYSLVAEARTKKNEIVAYKSVFFQRSKPLAVKEAAEDFTLVDAQNTFVSPVTNKDTLKDYIACLYPISSRLERQIGDNQIEAGNPESMKQFIYYFWTKRDAKNPEQKWLDYKVEVNKANESFATYNRKGYDTDRGRVFLQYGPPNTVDKGDRDPNTLPHEVWQYYVLTSKNQPQSVNQTNRKFVFYCREGASNNYELLHSDAIGEVFADDWLSRLHLYSTNIDGDDRLNNNRYKIGLSDRSQDRFDNPK